MYLTNVEQVASDVVTTHFVPDPANPVLAKIPFPELCEEHGRKGLVCFATFPIGAEAIAHTHDKTAEWYLIQKGRAKITVDRETRDLVAGDIVYTPLGSTHRLHDVTEELRFIAVEIPLGFISDPQR